MSRDLAVEIPEVKLGPEIIIKQTQIVMEMDRTELIMLDPAQSEIYVADEPDENGMYYTAFSCHLMEVPAGTKETPMWANPHDVMR